MLIGKNIGQGILLWGMLNNQRLYYWTLRRLWCLHSEFGPSLHFLQQMYRIRQRLPLLLLNSVSCYSVCLFHSSSHYGHGSSKKTLTQLYYLFVNLINLKFPYNNFKYQSSQSFRKLKNPSPLESPTKVKDTLALAGRATKSISVSPVMFPFECFPILLTLFSFPRWFPLLDLY